MTRIPGDKKAGGSWPKTACALSNSAAAVPGLDVAETVYIIGKMLSERIEKYFRKGFSASIEETNMVERALLPENSFLVEVGALRAFGRDLLESPPGRNGTSGGPSDAIALLQLALRTEIMCVCRYTMISLSHDGLKYAALGTEFQEQANDERRHMEMIADCIEKLGGTPAFDSGRPISLNSAIINSEKPLTAWLKENLDAEQCVIAHYRDLIGYFDKSDPKTSKILATIIRDEEEHSQDMQDLLEINS